MLSILEFGLLATGLQWIASDGKGPWDILARARAWLPGVVQVALKCERCSGFWIGAGLHAAGWSAWARADWHGWLIAPLGALVLVGVGRSLMSLGTTEAG